MALIITKKIHPKPKEKPAPDVVPNIGARRGRINWSLKNNSNNIHTIGEILAYLKFTPTRVEHYHMVDMFYAEGYSPMFRPITHGTVIPSYSIVVLGGGKYSVVEMIDASQAHLTY